MSLVSHPRRLFAFAAIGVATVALAATGVVQFRADHAWTDLRTMQNDLELRLAARDHRREPLWGESTPGRAFVPYAHALDKSRALAKTDDAALVRMLRRDDAQTAEDPEAVALRARWQPLLADLHAGAHAADASPPAPDDPESPGDLTNLLDARWIANCAMFEARVRRHRGEHLAAVQVSLDAATFAADLHRRGTLLDQMIATAIVAIATAETWTEPALARLDDAALQALAEGLARLDPLLPPTADHEGELAHSLRQIAAAPIDGDWAPGSLAAWRHGFSSRWMFADALLQQARVARLLANETALDWPQREALLEVQIGSLLASGNPVCAVMVPNTTAAERNLRESLTLVRLLRMSVAHHLGREQAPLRDPLGDGPLQVTPRDDGGVRLHSVGTEQHRKLARDVAP
jgi:hypothetical protein